MKNLGIRCIETRFIDRKKRDRIRFDFVSGDDIAPPPYFDKQPIWSKCVIKAGDIDPLSGKPVSREMIEEYYRCEDSQIRTNLRYERLEFTKKEQAARRLEKEAYMMTFREEHGYFPSKDDVRLHMEEVEPVRWNMLLSTLVEKENEEEREDCTDRVEKLSVPFEEMDSEDDSVEMQALLEVTANLTGRLALVWEAMYLRAAGGSERLRFKDLAEMWNVSQKRVSEYRMKIEKMIRKRAEELRQNEINDCIEE